MERCRRRGKYPLLSHLIRCPQGSSWQSAFLCRSCTFGLVAYLPKLNAQGIICLMEFRHQGLKRLAEQDDTSRLPPEMLKHIENRLAQLTAAQSPLDMDLPGAHLHRLSGDRAGEWSVRVTGNWRIVFRFEDGEAVGVDLIDYH